MIFSWLGKETPPKIHSPGPRLVLLFKGVSFNFVISMDFPAHSKCVCFKQNSFLIHFLHLHRCFRNADACHMNFPLLRQITPKMICFLPFFVSQKFSTIQVERPLVPDLRLGTSLRLNIRYQVTTVKTKIAPMMMIIMNWFNTFFKLSETGWWWYTSHSGLPGTPRPGACHFTYRSTSRLDGRWP